MKRRYSGWWWSRQRLEAEVVVRFQVTCDLMRRAAELHSGHETSLEWGFYMPMQEQMRIARCTGLMKDSDFQYWHSIGRVRNRIVLSKPSGSRAMLRMKIDEAVLVAETQMCRMPFTAREQFDRSWHDHATSGDDAPET